MFITVLKEWLLSSPEYYFKEGKSGPLLQDQWLDWSNPRFSKEMLIRNVLWLKIGQLLIVGAFQIVFKWLLFSLEKTNVFPQGACYQWRNFLLSLGSGGGELPCKLKQIECLLLDPSSQGINNLALHFALDSEEYVC